MLRYAIFVYFLVNVRCFTPNCVRENQFKFYKFQVEGCSESFSEKCRTHPHGYLKALGRISVAKIGVTDIVPTCAFHNLDGLKHILGVNSDIKVLATNGFLNLQNLQSINLAFNSIREIRSGVFNNVSVELVDFSWNKLVFIDSQAFSHVRDLRYLNLSHNFLQTLSINSLPITLLRLNVSYNLLDRIALNSQNFYNLSVLDLSDNLLQNIALLFSYSVKLIDLTNNQLTDFDYMEIDSVDLFKMAQNRFEDIPKYVENLNAKVIDIYPNPWKCHKLFLLWESLTSFNTSLAPKISTKDPPAECVTIEGKLVFIQQRSLPCTEDHECPDDMTCRARKCKDPCESSLCHKSSVCKTINHKFDCKCKNGFLLNPMDLTGECRKVDCFISSHCPNGETCLDQQCIVVQETPAYGFHKDMEDIEEESEPTETEKKWWYEDIPNDIPRQKRINSQRHPSTKN